MGHRAFLVPADSMIGRAPPMAFGAAGQTRNQSLEDLRKELKRELSQELWRLRDSLMKEFWHIRESLLKDLPEVLMKPLEGTRYTSKPLESDTTAAANGLLHMSTVQTSLIKELEQRLAQQAAEHRDLAARVAELEESGKCLPNDHASASQTPFKWRRLDGEE